MTASSHDLRSLKEWGPAPARSRSSVPAYGIPTALAAAVALLLATQSPVLGVVVFLAGVGALFLFGQSRGKAALKAAGARPATKDELPRIRNLLKGLASDLSTPVPELWVIGAAAGAASDAPSLNAASLNAASLNAASLNAASLNAASLNAASLNAMVAWRSGPVVAVAEGLEEALTRTECEAVLAHCMVRFASGEAKATTLSAGMGPFAPTGREAAGADLPAVAITRYPPALASVLEKVRPQAGVFAALWFAPDAGGDASPDRRSAALRDL